VQQRAATVTSPASVSRTRTSGEHSAEVTDGVSAKLASAGAVVIVMKKGLQAAQVPGYRTTHRNPMCVVDVSMGWL